MKLVRNNTVEVQEQAEFISWKCTYFLPQIYCFRTFWKILEVHVRISLAVRAMTSSCVVEPLENSTVYF